MAEPLQGEEMVSIPDEDIARRAFEISQIESGTDEENWHRAERELRTELAAAERRSGGEAA